MLERHIREWHVVPAGCANWRELVYDAVAQLGAQLSVPVSGVSTSTKRRPGGGSAARLILEERDELRRK